MRGRRGRKVAVSMGKVILHVSEDVLMSILRGRRGTL